MPEAMTVIDADYIRPYGVGFCNAVRCESGALRGFGRGGGDAVLRVSCSGCIFPSSKGPSTKLAGIVLCTTINIIYDFHCVSRRTARAR